MILFEVDVAKLKNDKGIVVFPEHGDLIFTKKKVFGFVALQPIHI
jgi:hypothetical protein